MKKTVFLTLFGWGVKIHKINPIFGYRVKPDINPIYGLIKLSNCGLSKNLVKPWA